MKGKKLLVIGGAMVLTVGIVGASTAFAHQRPYGTGPRHAIVNTVADTLGMDKRDLVAELRSGKTLAEVAQENGVDVDEVIETLVEVADERLDQAVESGRITGEEAEGKLASIEERISALVDKVLPMGHNFGRMMRHRGGHSIINAASEELGMDKRELVEALRGGSTISDLAAEQGVSTDAIISSVIESAGNRLTQAVENGAITQEKADERLSMVEEKVTEAMDKAWPAGGGQHGRGFGRQHNPGVDARDGGRRFSPGDNPGVSMRQFRGFNGGGQSAIQGIDGGIPQ
ncbi:MAG: hypothetical protein J4N99_07125 [Chloroflexi bacterium]|nr:hypothetical protein [Chloroflexota bacterium]